MAMEDAVAGNGHCHRGTVGLLLRVLRPPRDRTGYFLSRTASGLPPSLLQHSARGGPKSSCLLSSVDRRAVGWQSVHSAIASSERRQVAKPRQADSHRWVPCRCDPRLAFSGVPSRLESDFKVLGGPHACHTCRRLFTLAVNFSLHRVCHASPAAGALPALHASSRTSAGPTPSSRAR